MGGHSGHSLFPTITHPPDGPDVKRQVVSFKRATLTPITLEKVPRAAGSVTIKAIVIKQDLAAKWASTSWAKKITQRSTRQSLTDFDRFKLMVARKQRRAIVGKAAKKIMVAARK